ncbi:MAG: HIT domain-containing protein [Holosporales bacterium]|jgi:diadenosine tetraphosphate (Ap4A) HIT family hydrolase|nr:HIT domain-containing protein [Holosporales bacterium]
MAYDDTNVFAKILRREIASDPVFEDDYVVAFRDIHPKAPTHILVIPKGKYEDFYDFHNNASTEEICGFYNAIKKVVDMLGLKTSGFNLLSNCGKTAGQEVFHYHMHILSNKLGS